MTLSLDCFGASGEVGRSAFLLHTDKKILLDYGVKIFDKSGRPQFPSSDVEPDFAVISHAHLDHSGFVPALYRKGRIRWYATPPTVELCELLWEDSMKIMGPELPYKLNHFNRALKDWNPMAYGQLLHTGDTKITFSDAGHISGAAIVNIEHSGKKICYTGDFKMEDTFMHRGAKPVEDVDVLIMESTYAFREHPVRKDVEKQITDEIRETVGNGGTVLFPAFSLGRTQELLSLVRAYDPRVPVFIDGMGRKITNVYLRYPRYIRDANSFKKAVRTSTLVQGPNDKRQATEGGNVIISSAGMMSGGPVLNYLFNVNSESKVIFTGYCIEGTNGWKLQKNGYITVDERDLEVDLPVEYLDLSAHAGRSDLLNFIKWANPGRIVLVHGDETERFATELRDDFGYDAVAPKIGERIDL
jgi:putative mRNA 3-end processing factor